MSGANSTTRPEDQHYVSAAYLRSFVPDGERALFVRRRRKKAWFREVPENIATRKNFYSILREDGCWDDTLEHLLANEIEAPGFRHLQTLITSRTTLSREARSRVAILLVMQYLRVPQFREDLERVLKEFLQGFAEHSFADVEQTTADLQNLKGLTRAEATKEAAELRRALLSGDVVLKPRREAGLPYMFDLLTDGARVFEEYSWTVYVSQRPAFYACDRPVHISPSSVRENEVVAMVDPRVVIHCPLSSRRFLVVKEFGVRAKQLDALQRVLPNASVDWQKSLPPPIHYNDADATLIERFNAETARSCGEWICGPGESLLVDAELEKPQLRMSLDVTRASSGMGIQQKLLTRHRV